LAQHFDVGYRRHVAAGFRPVSIRRERTFVRDAENGRSEPALLIFCGAAKVRFQRIDRNLMEILHGNLYFVF
jgi:hypothetical protein